MLFVGIDQHKRHLTVCVRDEQGEIVFRRQVRTRWEEVDRFLGLLQERGAVHGGYVAVMEVCGFNGWLIKRLTQWGCGRVCVISAPERVRQKTDRRDAAKLSELLWINRDRIAAGQSFFGVVDFPVESFPRGVPLSPTQEVCREDRLAASKGQQNARCERQNARPPVFHVNLRPNYSTSTDFPRTGLADISRAQCHNRDFLPIIGRKP